MASDSCEVLLQAWFPKSGIKSTERRAFTEADVREIAVILQRTSDRARAQIPRIYSVLRIIAQTDAIEYFLSENITDVWFPFSQQTLPSSFKPPSARLDFLDTQHLVFNAKALDLERENTTHGHFSSATDIPLQKIGELGKGGYGFVDRVVSTISHREYARKLIPRGKTFRKNKLVFRAFERELSNLKRLTHKHIHIVDLVGSYTDPKYVGIIMLPVADCNLDDYLQRPLGACENSLLRNFFGCLTSALSFLHDSRIRHKDIKPQNVLLKDGNVFLTDFGVSLDWSELSHSTTTGPTAATPRYGAPEVANHIARNSSADIWSLGCVFLEIWTVLKHESTSKLLEHMNSTGTQSPCYCSNNIAVISWIETVRGLPGHQIDNKPVEWITHMLQHDRDARWTAYELVEHICECSSDTTTPFAFTGRCCLDDQDSTESVPCSSSDEDLDGTTILPQIALLPNEELKARQMPPPAVGIPNSFRILPTSGSLCSDYKHPNSSCEEEFDESQHTKAFSVTKPTFGIFPEEPSNHNMGNPKSRYQAYVEDAMSTSDLAYRITTPDTVSAEELTQQHGESATLASEPPLDTNTPRVYRRPSQSIESEPTQPRFQSNGDKRWIFYRTKSNYPYYTSFRDKSDRLRRKDFGSNTLFNASSPLVLPDSDVSEAVSDVGGPRLPKGQGIEGPSEGLGGPTNKLSDWSDSDRSEYSEGPMNTVSDRDYSDSFDVLEGPVSITLD